MDAFTELEILKSRAQKLAEDTRAIVDKAKKQMANQRLDRHDAEGLLEYTPSYSYHLNIPFDSRGYITYNRLRDWVAEHKPNRLKRLERNYKEFYRGLIQDLEQR
nr:hypothetical protein 15 [Balneolaceae bacterium]